MRVAANLVQEHTNHLEGEKPVMNSETSAMIDSITKAVLEFLVKISNSLMI